MLINTFLDTEDFVHLYYPEDEPTSAQGCGAGARARIPAKCLPRPHTPDYSKAADSFSEMSDSSRCRAPPQPEPPPHRIRAADLYPKLKTHYDESGLEVPYSPICGEFVQWVGRTADGGIIAMSNYRLHSQTRRRNGPGASIPLRLIDNVEVRDLLHLIVLCKQGRQLKCTFNTGEQCLEWWRRINTALTPISSAQETFAAAYAAWAKEQPPSSVHRALMRASHAPQRHWFGPEVERLGFTAKGAWRVTAANADYKLCQSYPPLLVVPASISDKDLDSVARFRAMRRIPAVVWRHRGNGAIIARSSQPEVGWFGWRSTEDEKLLAAFVTACNADRGQQPPNNNNKQQTKLLIIDARSYASAVTNRARGGGCECQQYYPLSDIQFMSLANIHHIRRSFQQMRALAAEPPELPNWHSMVERTLWLQNVCGVLRAACCAARGVLSARPVLVHCSDGWDRTPQICAAAELMLDAFYRTTQGFRVLIEREWLDFGHKFGDRCGHQFGPEEPNERSPIFLQWLDVVHQLMLQYPCSFEFNEAYMIKLATHVHSCMFGTFLCNSTRERFECRVQETTAQVWELLKAPAYRNHLYAPHQVDQVLWPDYNVRSMQVWWWMFSAERDEELHVSEPHPPVDKPATNGLMIKTRSCDNLLNEGEKRLAQRRSSDPSITVDVMKLSNIVVKNDCDSSRRECRGALTDSCVDDLPTITPTNDQVDGLHPDHFENASRLQRDIASDSSSLERELVSEITKNYQSLATYLPELNSESDVSQRSSVSKDISATIVNAMQDAAVRIDLSSDIDTPEDPAVFVCDTFNDIIGMAENARENGRMRNISITWRSISESSNQSSSGFDIPDQQNRVDNHAISSSVSNSHESSPLDNCNSTDGDVINGDVTNHNASTVELTNHNRENGVTNGVNGVDLSQKLLDVELNGDAITSNISSESEGEATQEIDVRRQQVHSRRVSSHSTLCPATCCHTTSFTSGIESSGSSSCGWLAGGADPLDGLPRAQDPAQARLHHIILHHQKVVDDLTEQLREAREALRRATPTTPNTTAPRVTLPQPSAPSPSQPDDHTSCVMLTSSGSASSSASGSGSEVEVGEEARGVLWLPDSAAPRCQHCRNHFWLARRRHHCRRCGGIFCGSCSEMSPWGDCVSVRMCRRCRTQR